MEGERRKQTGPMCVRSAVENNVHTGEALMRFKNNGDYLRYSLGVTRTRRRTAFASRCTDAIPAIPRFWPSVLPRYANANPTPGAWQRRITRGKTMPRKKTHYTAITILPSRREILLRIRSHRPRRSLADLPGTSGM